MERLKLDIQRFATSGTLTTPNNTDGTSFYFTWSRQSYSIAENKSTIYWQIGINAAYSYQSNAVKLGATTVDGRVIHSGGTYSNISRGTHTMFEGIMDIYHNPDGTKSFSASLSGWTWESTWTSADNSNNPFVLNTIPRYATCTQSLNSKTETSIKMNWSSDSTIDYVWYSKDNGTNWTAVGSVNATSGNYTISGLTANTNYQIKTRVRRKDSQLTTDSSASSIATYNYPNCTSAPNFTIGDNSVTISIYNPLNRSIELQMYSHVGNVFINSSRIATNINGNFSFPVGDYNNELYASIPNNKTSQYNIDVWYGNHKEVKSGGYYSVNESINTPTFNNFTYEDTDATTLALTGNNQIIVKGYSDVRATVTNANKAVAKNSATMKKYNLIIGSGTNFVNYSADSTVTVSLNNVSSNIIKLNAEDSRGLTKEVPKTLEIPTYYKEYTDIQKGNINITRQGNVGEAVTLEFNGTYWNNSFGSVTNTITSSNISYRYKKTSDNNWSTGSTTITPTLSNNTYSFSGGILGDTGSGFNTQYSYNIEITVSDKLSTTTFTFVLGSGQPWIGIHDNGLAIKQPYDTSDDSVLQVNGKTHLKGNTSITGNVSTTGSATIGSNSTIAGSGVLLSLDNSTNNTDTYLKTNASWAGKSMGFGIGGGGVNRGIWDWSLSKWTFYLDDSKLYSNGNTEIKGNLNTTGSLQVSSTNVVASGTGNSAYYTKYYDGTMICYGTKSGTTTYGDFFGFCQRSPDGDSTALQVTLPQSFKDTNYFITVTPDYKKYMLGCAIYSKATGNFRVVCYKPKNTGESNYGFNWIAVGKWK